MRQRSHLNLLFFAFLLAISISFSSRGQEQSQYDKGTPPQHAGGVSPLGSYTSTDLGSVNLSNGGLNFKIPLTTIGGRGFSIPLTLNYSSKVWSASSDTDVDNQNQQFSAAYADYANIDNFVDIFERIGPGWTIGAAPMIFNRIVPINRLTQGPNTGCYTFILPKLTVMLPDKGEIEFRDDAYDGQPLAINCSGVAVSRGRRWHATDGSGTIYISDIDDAASQRFGDLSGVVITADGTRYRFTGSRCTSITDRNGNRIDITYTSQPTKVEYKDQLGRITKIEQFVADPDNPSITLAVLVTIPGYSGNHYIKIKRNVMSANYRSDITAPAAVCTGTYDPLNKGYWNWCGSSSTTLFPHSYGLFMQRIDNQQVLTEVVLPDQRSLRFKYNLFGEVAEAQLPTGGKLWYEYEYQSTVPSGNSPAWEIGGANHTEVTEIDRALVQRRIFDSGGTLQTTWDYSYTGSYVIVVATSPLEGILRNERHLFLPALRYTDYIGGLSPHDGTYYSLWSTGVEWRTEIRNADGTAVLAAEEKEWRQRAPVSWSGYQQEQPANDNRVIEERRYLETGMMAKTERTYDLFNNPTEIKEYDYDQTLKRRTVISYLSVNNNSNYRTDDSIHLLRLPVTQTVFDGLGNQKSQSVTEYDNYNSGDGNHGSLTNYCSEPPNNCISQHDSNYGSSKTTRGNPTRVDAWVNTTGSILSTFPRYDVLGNVISMKDPRGNVSTTSFADDFGNGSNPGTPSQNPPTPTYALPTLFTSAAPGSGGPAQTGRSQYDYATGLVTGVRDPNNVVTQTIYNDPFNRPTQVNAAIGVTGVESRTLMYYAPAVTPFGVTLSNNDVLTAKDQTALGASNLRSWTVTDSFGRTIQAWSLDPQGDLKVETTYDGLGRAKKVSNPYRPSLPGETADYTITTYDLLGRTTVIKTPDNALVTTSYSANTVTVTDQAGKARKSVTDALGRLTSVFEDPKTGGLNYETTYTYDTLDNLVKVTQGSQQRFFMYDSLKRLIRTRNPEQEPRPSLALSDPVTGNSAWSIAYEYDAGGNMIKKTDARGVESTYGYDALNRNTTIDYSDTNFPYPDIKNFYDGATNGIGRFWYAYKGGDETNGPNVDKTLVDSYDALGKPVTQKQSFKRDDTWTQASYDTSRSYDLAGNILTQTYPSNRSVSYTYNAANRTASFSGNLGGQTRTYATGITYNSWGAIGREQFGTNTPLYHKSFYNVRGQLFDTRVSSVNDTWDWNRGRLIYYYSSNHLWGQSGTDNNGNVQFAQTWIPPENATLDQSDTLFEEAYSYDELNRLISVVGQSTSVPTWGAWQQQYCQTYDYDRYGNRTIDTNPLKTSGTGINNKLFEKDIATNRLYAPGDLALPDDQRRIKYDGSGNQTKDTYTGYGSATFDAENHIATIAGYGTTANYTYNAGGQRTRRKIGNQETWQIYGMDGELLAEYPANGSPGTPQKEYGYRNGQLLITATQGSGDQSLNLNGTGAHVQVPNSSSINITGSLTVEAWVKVNAITSSYQDIITRESYAQSGTGGGFELSLTNTGKLRLDTYQNPTSYTTLVGNMNITAGAWHHVAGVFDGNQMRLYVDGVLDATLSTTNGPASGTSTLKIGRASYGSYFGGLIDEARVSNAAVYTGNFTPQTHLAASSSTKGLWKFDGQSTADSSVNGNDGSLQSGATYSSDVASGDGGGGGTSSVSSSLVQWLVADHLGTPRMIIDQTGTLANLKRHDYLPFGEELIADTAGRSPSLGYTGGDGLRQQFTSKERDIETGLDCFGGRYFASIQGRFTGADSYDINLDRQNTRDPEEADALFKNYITQAQHWNRYAYALNNPLRYVDPDGLIEYETELLGQKIKVHIDDSIIKNDPDALKRIQDNLQKGFDKINSGAASLSEDQIESIHSQNRIYVSNDNPGGTMGGTYYMTQREAENPNIDKMAADIIHDSRHSEQFARGISYNEKNAIPMEREASLFTVGVITNIGGWSADVIEAYEVDAITGHLPSGMRDKSTPKSLAKIFDTMNKPQKRRK
jgi:RHS repeat-associated protein